MCCGGLGYWWNLISSLESEGGSMKRYAGDRDRAIGTKCTKSKGNILSSIVLLLYPRFC
jgi:hypothetical protein